MREISFHAMWNNDEISEKTGSETTATIVGATTTTRTTTSITDAVVPIATTTKDTQATTTFNSLYLPDHAQQLHQPSLFILLLFGCYFIYCAIVYHYTSRVYRTDLLDFTEPILELALSKYHNYTLPIQICILLSSSITATLNSKDQKTPRNRYLSQLEQKVHTRLEHSISLLKAKWDNEVTAFHFTYEISHKELSDDIYNHFSFSGSSSIYDIDENLNVVLNSLPKYRISVRENGTNIRLPLTTFFILTTETMELLQNNNKLSSDIEAPINPHHGWIMGTHTHGWAMAANIHDNDEVWDGFRSILELMNGIYTLSYDKKDMASNNVDSDMNSKNYKVQKPTPQMRYSFSVLTAEPSPSLYGWTFSSLYFYMIEPLIAALKPIIHISVDSQLISYGRLTSQIQTVKSSLTSRNTDTRESPFPNETHYISSKQLIGFVGNTHWNRISPLVTASIEFLIYVPPHSHRPLFVCEEEMNPQKCVEFLAALDPQQNFLPKNSFLSESFFVPDWGVVFLANVPNASPESQHSSSSNGAAPSSSSNIEPLDDHTIERAMSYFIGNVRSMFGLPDCVYQPYSLQTSCILSNTSRLLGSAHTGISEWELNALLVSHTHYYSRHIGKSLTSLSELLKKVPFMPVSDDIGIAVSTAIEALKSSYSMTFEGDWETAARRAREGSILADEAFFDPTMMPMLYFPEDHLIAVYLPYFFPIFIPFLMTVISRLRNRKRKQA